MKNKIRMRSTPYNCLLDLILYKSCNCNRKTRLITRAVLDMIHIRKTRSSSPSYSPSVFNVSIKAVFVLVLI